MTTRIKVTHPVRWGQRTLEAGLIYDVPPGLANGWVDDEKAFVVEPEPILPAAVVETPKKKVKNDNG